MTGPSTADLMDEHPDAQVAHPGLRAFGGRPAFSGPIHTVVAPEDNTLVRAELETAGDGRVLVVDGLGSLRCALVGDNVAQLAIDNGWAGIVVHGCIRDAGVIDAMPTGVHALATNPRKSVKAGQGRIGEIVEFLGVTFRPGDELHADRDGVIVLP